MDVCPFCRNTVEPTLDANGQLVCPACLNTGQVQTPPARAAPPPPPPPSYPPAHPSYPPAPPSYPQAVPPTQAAPRPFPAPAPAAPQPFPGQPSAAPQPFPAAPPGPPAQPFPAQQPAAPQPFPATPMTPPAYPASQPWTAGPAAYGAPGEKAPGATASLVLGILAFFTWIFGIVLAILALVFGYKAKRLIAESGGRLQGAGQAKAGRILGWVYIALIPAVVILAAVVFVLVNNLGAGGGTLADETVTIPSGDSYLQGFRITGSNVDANYTIVSNGLVAAGFYAVDDANNPMVTNLDGWGEASGRRFGATTPLPRGDYALAMTCQAPTPCTVHFTIGLS